jgi:uncharacterized protein involved in outer membrane biogenesis
VPLARHGQMTIWSRRTRIILIAATGLIVLLLIMIAAFPAAWLKGTAERQLSAQVGSPVRIAAMDRESLFSFSPVIRLTGIDITQPGWAGQGKLASVALLRVRVHLAALLGGGFKADVLTAKGVRLDLVRAADGRVNWRVGQRKPGGRSTGDGFNISSVEDAIMRYRDDRQKRAFTIAIAVSPKGLQASGSGEVDGAPVKLTLHGAPMVPGRRWPFDALIDGPALRMHVAGAMAAPLRTSDMRFRATARADDLKRIDRVIEAGLFGTQPVDLAADVARQGALWTVERLTGRIGESTLTGRLTARKGERVTLDGEVRFSRLNFDDLASEAGNARALALQREQGLRLVPNTRVNIRKIHKTDGRIALRVDRILGGRRPSSLRNLSGVLTIDDRILTVAPLRIGLSRGVITGRAVVDQRSGQPKPTVTLALDMTDSSIAALAGGGGKAEINARVDARVRLTGVGDTIREAVGNSDGNIGVIARSGFLPSKIAALMGFDIGKAAFGDDETHSALRCGVLRLDVRHGRGMADPLILDTGISQSRGIGTMQFPAEAWAITLTGAPKRDALRLPGSVLLRGTVREPEIVVPKGTKSFGNVLKAIGRAIGGRNGPAAADADCVALSRRAIGR